MQVNAIYAETPFVLNANALYRLANGYNSYFGWHRYTGLERFDKTVQVASTKNYFIWTGGWRWAL